MSKENDMQPFLTAKAIFNAIIIIMSVSLIGYVMTAVPERTREFQRLGIALPVITMLLLQSYKIVMALSLCTAFFHLIVSIASDKKMNIMLFAICGILLLIMMMFVYVGLELPMLALQEQGD